MKNKCKTKEEVEVAPVANIGTLMREQISRHLAKLKPYKAPRPDGSANIILTKCADLLFNRLHHIYNAMVDHDLFYKPWKQFTTVALRKPGKPKYNVPKVYHQHYNGKSASSILVEQLMYYADKHQLLPANHFEGRKGCNFTNVVQLLVHRIENTL